MQKHYLKFTKVFTNIACSPLILISNNSELAAKYLPQDDKQSFTTQKISNNNNVFFQELNIKQERNLLIAQNKENIKQESVLISEIIIEGWENHPEEENLNWPHMIL